MRRRKLVIALAAAAVFGVLVVPASAELHRVTVTLVTGQTLTMTVDVPPGSSVQSIQIPGLPAPVQSITDLGPVATPTPVPVPTAVPTRPPAPEVPTPRPAQEPSRQQGGNDGSGGGGRPTPAAPNQGSGSKGGGKRTPAGGRSARAELRSAERRARGRDQGRQASTSTATTRRATPTARRPSTTRPSRSRCRARRASACRTSSSRSSASRRSCCRSTRPPASSTACAGRCSPRSTRSRPTTAATSTSPPPAPSGWMQFMPGTWELYGVDGNQDGVEDPYNPVDAIFAAARYLRAAGADKDLRAAIYAYNHADWYVDSVILRARYIGGLPADLVGSLSGLTQGRFPVQAKAAYAKEVRRKDIKGTAGGQEPRLRGRVQLAAQGHQDLRPPRRPGGRRERRPHRQGRREPPARHLRRAAGRLRQHLHVRAPQGRRREVPDAEAALGRQGPGRARAAPADARRRARRPRVGHDRGRGEGAQGVQGPRRREAAPRRSAPRLPPRSACSPTPTARTPRRPAASSSPTSARRTSAATSTASSASIAPAST